MKVSPIYNVTLNRLKAGARRISHQGGQYSGKTVNILGALATLAAEDEPGVTTVTSQSMPHLKGGALRDFEMFCYPTFKGAIKKYHRTDHLFSFRSGHLLEFKVFDTEYAARGSKRKRLFVNEANKYEWMTYWQLDSRSDQTIIDYNPTIEFFAHTELLKDGQTEFYYSDHRHNPFLTDAKHNEIENICIFKRDKYGNVVYHKDINGKDDKTRPVIEKGNFELWKVYARGLTGNVTGVIYPYWEMIDEMDFPTDPSLEWVYSVDFGYTVDPTAIVKICKIADTFFVKELAYYPGISPVEIRQLLISNGYEEHMPLYCEHDPEQVRLLRNLGVSAYMARKGQGSVNTGIQLLNKYKVKYPHTSRNLHRERGMYIWDTDKATGKSLNKPVDKNNHLMDASRYGITTQWLRDQI